MPAWAGGRQESGLANVIYQLAKHGSEVNGAEVTLVATDSFVPERKDGKLTILGWTKNRLTVYILIHPFRAVSSILKLCELKKKYPFRERFAGLYMKRIFFEKTINLINPQVIHLHGYDALWYVDLVPNDVKITVTFHGMNGLDKKIPQHEILFNMERDVFHSERLSEVFFISSQLVTSFKGAYGDNGKRNRVIFNSYDKSKFYYEEKMCVPARFGENRNITTLCTVASLSDLKGQLRVLTALNMLSGNKRFRYFCIGEGSEEMTAKLTAYANENDIDFSYLGKMNPDDIRKHLYSADYMIMPSSSEGFGLAYLEAIACGVPVILPKGLPIAQEKELINGKNSILLDDCSDKSIAKVLGRIDEYVFNHQDVASTISGLSWDDVARQYYMAFKEM